jgi:hypothetical protein
MHALRLPRVCGQAGGVWGAGIKYKPVQPRLYVARPLFCPLQIAFHARVHAIKAAQARAHDRERHQRGGVHGQDWAGGL